MRLRVQFEINVPDDMPLEDAEEWISFEIGATSQMRAKHPEMNRNLHANYGSVRVTT